ncbi:MAG: ROK family protein [Propionicimonas sp.]
MSVQGPTAGRGAAVLAVDVGGTQIKSAVLDHAGVLGPIRRTPTPRSAGDPGGAVVAAVAQLVAEAAGTTSFRAVGVAVPGHVDEGAGTGIRSTNLGWRDYPFTTALRAATGQRIALAHDVRAAGEAEARIGAAHGFDDVAVVTIGTGVAAALRLGGRSYTGRGLAGELGHTVVVPDGPECRCGGNGCLEAIASAGALERRYQQESARSVDGAHEILRLARAGDPLARRIWEEAIAALVTGLAQLSALVAPEAVVIGGGLAEAGEELLEPLRAGLARSCRAGTAPVLLLARLGQDAGTWGAALAARDLLAAVQP